MSNVFEGKRILITGATGLIGRNLVCRMLEGGANVIAYGRSETKLKRVFQEKLECENFVCKAGDISVGFPDEIGRLDYIFHAASPISGAEIKNMPVDTVSANMYGTLHCLDNLKKQGKGRMIVFSSATVYGNNPQADISVTEDMTDRAYTIHEPSAPYCESKRMVEVIARAYEKQYNVDSVIARIGYVYGYSEPKPNTAFYEFIGNAIDGKDIVINHSGMGRRDNIYVDDVVSGLLLLAEAGERGESYNLSSNGDKGNFCAVDEMANIICETAKELKPENQVKVVIKKEEKRSPGIMLDNSKIKKLGWDVKVSIEEGIKRTVAAYVQR